MKKLLVILMLAFATFALADVNVTYVVNMSTLKGMGVTDSTHSVQICGADNDVALSWDDASALTTNVGGDYWELKVAYPNSMVGNDIEYKIRYKGNDEDEYKWENYPSGGNRNYTMPSTDTTLQVAYVNNAWEPPYTPSDSIDVFFRVNMSADESFTTSLALSIVGDLPAFGNGNIWSPGTYELTQEGSSDFWNIHLKFAQTALPVKGRGWRFHNNGLAWDGHSENLNNAYGMGENRKIDLPASDTTIAWVWWNDIPGGDFGGTDSANIVFGVDMSAAVQNNGFEIGDTLEVRFGYELSSNEVHTIQMTHVGGTQMYQANAKNISVIFGEYLYYQYYMIKKGVEEREVYYNFNYDGSIPNAAERRRVIIANKNAEIADIKAAGGEERRMPFFRNRNLLAREVTVHVECDLRPAYAAVAAGKTLNDIQGAQNISLVSQINGVAMNGPFSNYSEGAWAGWGSSLMADTNRVMYDDGTHGDATAGDSIFTLTYVLHPDSGHTVAQECKFGINGGDNEGGEGGYGNNHIVNIDDSKSESYLYIAFGSINPTFYSDWTPTRGVAVEDVPSEYTLAQNYPNPFNPVTTISFTIPSSANVKLSVFDMTGRHVKTLVNGYVNSGAYDVIFDGANLSSGVYFYQLTAGNTSMVNKMILMK